MASYICDLCGWQSNNRAALISHLRDEHGVNDPAETGSMTQTDGLLILRSGDNVTAIDLDAWLAALLTGTPAQDTEPGASTEIP
ncbi:MAG: hypothetical protein BWY52_01783 [Chloroflexi bacterium ADurb.Bin325]|nr:MAG: hypothetical protein BWY52_01783 [Chloroflexi bacterium ADurb.Bin325]